jgi:hypothetical protein
MTTILLYHEQTSEEPSGRHCNDEVNQYPKRRATHIESQRATNEPTVIISSGTLRT